jgi:hypothetical protein
VKLATDSSYRILVGLIGVTLRKIKKNIGCREVLIFYNVRTVRGKNVFKLMSNCTEKNRLNVLRHTVPSKC